MTDLGIMADVESILRLALIDAEDSLPSAWDGDETADADSAGDTNTSEALLKLLAHRKYEDVVRRWKKTFFNAALESDSGDAVSSDVDVAKNVENWLAKNEILRHLELFALGVSALQLFVLINWAGLDLAEEEGWDFCSSHSSPLVEKWLVMDGESLAQCVRHHRLLLVARTVFAVDNKNAFGNTWSFQWWRLRSCLILQRILTEKSQMLHDEATTTIASLGSNKAWLESPLRDEEFCKEARIMWNLEVAHFHATFYELSKVRESVDAASALAGLNLKETGAMGKRTKYQYKDCSQLTLDITRSEGHVRNETARAQGEPEKDLIVDLKLDDDLRLERIAFVDSEGASVPTDLSLTEQCIVLAAFTLKQRSQPNDELTHEELMPYLNAVLWADSTCWAVRGATLILRSKLEAKDRRAVERAMMQVQAIVDSVGEGKAGQVRRMRRIYCSRMPPVWEVELELIWLLQSLGSVKAALDIALRLHLWEDVVSCYHQLQLRHKAADVIRAEIERQGETPLLLCMLGDATDDVAHYHRAFEVSGQRSARACRSLGFYYYFKNDYAASVEHLKKSLDLNAFQLNVLIRLGYAAMQIEDWKTAAETYRTYCSYESDNFEAWNNLSNAYVKMGQKARAWKVLQEAAKSDFDNWRIWDNIMVVSTDCAHFEEVLRAYHRLLDLRDKHVDTEVLSILVGAINADLKDNMAKPCSRFRPQAQKLFGRLTSKVTSEGRIWELYADLIAAPTLEKGEAGTKEGASADLHRVCELLRKSVACHAQKSGWEKEAEKSLEVLRVGMKYATGSLEYSNCPDVTASEKIQLLSSAKMSLKSNSVKVKNAHRSMETDEVVEALRKPVEDAVTMCDTLEERVLTLKS